MSDIEEIHSCGYHCDNPLCIRRQRDFLAEQLPIMEKKIEELTAQIEGYKKFERRRWEGAAKVFGFTKYWE